MRKRFLVYIPLILLCSILLTGCTEKDEDFGEKIKMVDSQDEGKETEKKEEETKKDSSDLGYLSNPDEYAKSKKSIGELTDAEYTLESLEDSQSSGYHTFDFNISTSTEGAVLPSFTVEPVLDKGVYRVTIRNVSKDNSGIPHQQSRAVDKGAVTGVYRSVTSTPKTVVYEIGFLGNNPFKLDYIETDINSWNISVKVAYDLKYSPPTIDFGSTEFSNTVQSIEGMTASDGARISSYSYSISGGVLKFVFSVASGTSNPIPSVEAEYDDMNILEVRFTSLKSDRVSTWGNSITLPGGIVVDVSRAGEVSSYRFGGIGGAKQFKLSANQSPNQVVVEIKTN